MTANPDNEHVHPGISPHRKMLIVLAAVAGVIAVLALQHFVLKGRADRLLEKFQAQGHPTDLFQVNESYSIPSGATNAADKYMPAFNALIQENRADTNGPVHFRLESPIDDYPDNLLRFVRVWVATNETVIAQLHEAARHPHCRYPLDYTQGFNTLLPHLSQAKHAARVLSWDAFLSAETGNIDAAMDSLHAALAVSDSTGSEPDIIG